jgi:hypothetical protein
MKRGWLWCLTVCALPALTVLSPSAAGPGITFVGMGFVPGNALDLSGLAGQEICQREDETVCIDKATLGGFGSALTYTGHDGVFLAVPDRGPYDGRTRKPSSTLVEEPYLDRFHFIHIALALGAPFPNITTTLLDTRFLKSQKNENLVGDAYAFNAADFEAGLRFDPEGVALGRNGTFFVSDEYGPSILNFNREGHLIGRIPVPSKFLLGNPPPAEVEPSGDVDSGGNSLELFDNTLGRQANRGMEGLAITPDGRMLVGIMQNALLQDKGWNTITSSRVGLNNRILTIDLKTGETHEYVYVMDAINQGRGVNEILALNDHEFLVLERDNRTRVPTPPNAAQTPNLKRIYRIDLAQAGLTDVSDIDELPAAAASPLDPVTPITPVTKTLFIDLLDPAFMVNATQTIRDVIAEKIEGMAWGPDLPDGRHMLYVVSDNDLFPGLPTQIFAFAIDAAAAGITYEPQQLPMPLYLPAR